MSEATLAETATPGGSAHRFRVDRATVVVIGITAFYLAMTVYAALVFQQFAIVQVLGVALAFAVVFAVLIALLSTGIRTVRLRPTPLSVTLGFVMAGVLFVLAFTWTTNPGPIWSEYFPAFPNYELAQGGGFHQDAVFHVSLIQSILDFGYPSTGQNGVPLVPYHVLSHYTDALVLVVTRLEPYDSYGLFFHFKVTLFLTAIVTFIWMATRTYGRWLFVGALVFLTPVLLSTWIGVGSHSLWLTSLILVLSAKRVFEIVTRGPSSAREWVFIFLLGVAVGLGKVSSGLMFVVVVGVLLWLKSPRRWEPFVLVGAWLVFFGAYGSLFTGTGHGSGLQRPSVRGTLHFLDFFITYGGGLVEWNLGAVYMLLILFCLFAAVFRSREAVRYVIATVAGIGALAFVTQVLAGLTQPDLFYFIFGLLVPLVLLGVQELFSLLPRAVRLPTRMRRLSPGAARALLVLLLVASTWPLDKPSINAFTLRPATIGDSLAAANSAYFDQYNPHQAPADRVTVASIILERDALDLSEPAEDTSTEFRTALREFMRREDLTSRNTLLFVPTEVFDSSLASFGGPSWARGVLLYALTGVPLLHGVEDTSMLSFGQSSYGPDALQQSLAEFDPEDACSRGKQVIVVRNWAPAAFSLACPA